MGKNNLRVIRKSKKWSLVKAAEKIGISYTQLARLETSERGLTLPMAEKIAKAWEFDDVTYLIGIGASQSADPSFDLSADAEPYEGKELAPLGPKAKGERWRIIRPSLDLAGIPDRAIAFVDTTVDNLERLQGLEKVLAMAADPNTGELVPITRQFLPPCLLVTNSSVANDIPLNTRAGEAIIRGIIRAHIVVD
jgi:transcriptional regulator with XRE-family HTH domain